MSTIPKVNLGDLISVGKDGNNKAVVSRLYEEYPNRVVVVYFQNKSKYIYENVIWENDHWNFQHSGPSGGYAEKSSYHASYIDILRRGKK